MRNIYDDTLYNHLCSLADGKSSTTQFILGVLLGGSVVITGALFPNMLKIFSLPGVQYKKPKYSAKKLQASIYYLKKQHYIKILKDKNGKIKIRITAKGKKHITKILAKTITIPKPKKWDKKWRVLLFDIPIEKNSARLALRRKIKELHFFQLQKSVWVHPYPCEDELLFMAHELDIEPYIEIFTADKLLHEKDVRAYFKLP